MLVNVKERKRWHREAFKERIDEGEEKNVDEVVRKGRIVIE